MSTPTQEQIAEFVADCRAGTSSTQPWYEAIVAAIADENGRLRAEVADVRARWADCEKHNTELGVANERYDRERAEVVALLEDPRRGHDEWWSRAISLLAKLRGTP